HTRSKRDWSSDVCSSDLLGWLLGRAPASAVPLKCFLFTPRASARSRGRCHPRRPAKAWVARRITPAKNNFCDSVPKPFQPRIRQGERKLGEEYCEQVSEH